MVEVARRGGFDIIRPRHPENPLRERFGGTPAYEPEMREVYRRLRGLDDGLPPIEKTDLLTTPLWAVHR
ncbi:hypothetical protein ACIA5D_27460 [Actinoplanes sp. NPDC051513]|uniref:hypothetical protein n=1 Tax=Actinoplanes sp. NPDC051513 TaxID=3363908 RepID=UPI0037BCF57B